MKNSRRFPGGFTLECEVDMIETSDCIGHRERDETWTYVDLAGHRHSWDSNTWTRVQDEENWFDQDGYEYNGASHAECDICGEHLVPGTIYVPPSMLRQFIPGMTHYTLKHVTELGGGRFEHVRQLTEEEALAFISEHS